MEVLLVAIVVVIIYFVVRGLAFSASTQSQTTHRDWDPDQDVRTDESRCFLLAVVGESFRNDDGTSRQKIIQRCAVGEPIQLVREPKNRYDKNAIKVCRLTGEQLGHIGREAAAELAGQIDDGLQLRAEIHAIYGGTADEPSVGVVLRIGILSHAATAQAQ